LADGRPVEVDVGDPRVDLAKDRAELEAGEAGTEAVVLPVAEGELVPGRGSGDVESLWPETAAAARACRSAS
jgi:hypothetical protein